MLFIPQDVGPFSVKLCSILTWPHDIMTALPHHKGSTMVFFSPFWVNHLKTIVFENLRRSAVSEKHRSAKSGFVSMTFFTAKYFSSLHRLSVSYSKQMYSLQCSRDLLWVFVDSPHNKAVFCSQASEELLWCGFSRDTLFCFKPTVDFHSHPMEAAGTLVDCTEAALALV